MDTYGQRLGSFSHEQEQRRYEGLMQSVQRDVHTALVNYVAATRTVEFYRLFGDHYWSATI
jgi:hypothetical protein